MKKGFFSFRSVLIAFTCFMVMTFLINGPVGMGKLLRITGGHSILDMEMRGYSVERAYQVLEALGKEGRAFDLKTIVPLDFPFPLSYGVFYFITLTLIVKTIHKDAKRPWLVGLIGLAAALFDWLENVTVIILLQNYPQRMAGVVRVGSVFTQAKSFFITCSIGFILIGLIIIGVRFVWRKVRGEKID